jgi:hypothetical protein
VTVVEAVRERLLAVTAFTAIVDERVYPLILPQSPTLPATRVQQIDRDDPMHLRGTIGLISSRVQVDHFAKASSGVDPYAKAHDMANAARGTFDSGAATGLAGWQGTIGSPVAIAVGMIRLLDEREEFVPDELHEVRVSQDYLVVWRSPE